MTSTQQTDGYQTAAKGQEERAGDRVLRFVAYQAGTCQAGDR